MYSYPLGNMSVLSEVQIRPRIQHGIEVKGREYFYGIKHNIDCYKSIIQPNKLFYDGCKLLYTTLTSN